MDEYLSEKEQIERLRAWLRENGLFLLAGAGLGLLGLFGYNRYEAYVTSRGEEAASLWLDAQRAVEQSRIDDAEAALAQLKDKHKGSGYTDNTALLLARAVLDTEPGAAAAELRYVIENTEDPNTALIARERLARVLAYDERYDEALAVLDIDDPGTFTARFKEIEGDIYYARGAFEDARRAYVEAMVSQGSEILERQFLQIKLFDVIAVLDAAESPASASADEQAGGGAGSAESQDSATQAEPAVEAGAEPAETDPAEAGADAAAEPDSAAGAAQ